MYRKYILDRLDAQQQQGQPSSQVASTFPDTNLIVGEAQSKAARAGAAHRKDSGGRFNESGTFRSDRSDSGIESELGGSKSSSGTKADDFKGSFKKETSNVDREESKVELKSHRDWTPYKKPLRVKSEPDITKTKSVKQKSDSGVQCEIESSGSDSRAFRNDPQSESRISHISSFSEGCIESRTERRPPRHIRYNDSDVDLFDDFVSRDHIPEFRRPPKEITVSDIERGISQTVAVSSKPQNDGESPPPIRLWDAHGCHDVRHELIVAKPIAEAAKRKPQSPMSFQSRRSDSFSRMLVETAHPAQRFAGPSGKVLPIQDVGKSKMGHLVTRNEMIDPKKLSPRYSNHLQGEHPWVQATHKGKMTEKPLQAFDTSPRKPGTPVSSGATGCYSSLCCNKGAMAKR